MRYRRVGRVRYRTMTFYMFVFSLSSGLTHALSFMDDVLADTRGRTDYGLALGHHRDLPVYI